MIDATVIKRLPSVVTSAVSQAVQGLLETPDSLYLAAEKPRSGGSITELHRAWCTMVSPSG